MQLRNLVARQVQAKALDGALAVYWDDKNTRWRFSYIAVIPKLDEQGRIIKEETAHKRYTYLLGEGTQVRTAVDRCASLPTHLTLEQLSRAFAVEPLNREFYQKLYEWYQRAERQVIFPNDEQVVPKLHIANSLIRLLTRLLFVWFIKEKGLINPNLFDPEKVKQLIDWERPSSYYKAILQNLFFATLNREIKNRQFRTTTNGKANSNNYLIFNLYRYQSYFQDPDTENIISLFVKTPFLNGGLFECLDRKADKEEITAYERNKTIRNERIAIRMDGFSDRDDNQLSVPNDLFFNEDERRPGLINLLSQYQFTIEESAPLDVEVALDPELLGLVFENLLAAYNPETKETARKQTGSYYTPREIVSYMVDESLKAYLEQTVPPAESDAALYRERLDDLFSEASTSGELKKRDGTSHSYEQEIPKLIKAISKINILDPAVGSGAFPMGALQRLVSLLAILDPNNKQWKKQQLTQLPSLQSIEQDLKTAGNISDDQARHKAEEELRKREQEIRNLFDQQDHSYLRKLYLIENCLFGVDIQPIAIQIAKLRFFISLVIEQNPTKDQANNYGILALPNLETKFIAANSLIGLSKPKQGALRDLRIKEKEKQLQEIRHKHFSAKTLKTKGEYRQQDEQLRGEIAKLLQGDGWDNKDARKIAYWNPYNQNAVAGWFEPEWMFGVRKGFDVVIGNPPYVVTNDKQLRKLYKEGVYGRANTYGLFIQRGLQLNGAAGQIIYINPRTLLTDRYFTSLRKVINQQAQLKGVVLIADRHNTFESVLQECIVLHLKRKKDLSMSYLVNAQSVTRPDDLSNPHNRFFIGSERVLLGDDYDGAFYIGASEFEYQVFERMNAGGVKLADFGIQVETGKIQFDKYQNYAQRTNANEACRLIWAENIQRYTRREARKRIGKEWLRKDIVSVVPANITGTGVVTQRTSANEQPRRIIATLVTPESVGSSRVYSENGTNFIAVGSDSKFATFLISVLNSSLMEFLFRHLNSNVHVSAGEINSLPFPPLPDDKTLEEIETLVAGLLALGGVDSPAGNIEAAIEKERRLDILIGSLYGFSVVEVERVQELLPSYETVYGM